MRTAIRTLTTSPPARRLMQGSLARPTVERFVAGVDLAQALAAVDQLAQNGLAATLDLLGEGVADSAGADSAADQYVAALAALGARGDGDVTIAVKPSQLGLYVGELACRDRLHLVCDAAAAAGTSVEIDMEGSADVEATLALYDLVKPSHPTLRLALQAYLRRTPFDLERLKARAPRIRLVKGAYFEPRELAYQRRSDIDAQYALLTEWLCEHSVEPVFATHDTALIAAALDAVRRHEVRVFELQMLYGVRRDLQRALANEGVPVRVYVPYGAEWYPYLSRRIAERPANLRFLLRALVGG